MKKINYMFGLLFIIGGLLFSGTLNVSSPQQGAVWNKGTQQTINWTATGCSDPNIKINIFRNSVNPANFVEQLTCTGCSSKIWTIPSGYTNGTYVIRVKTADGQCVGDSGAFTIGDGSVTPPPPAGSINVTNPPSPTSSWMHGFTNAIIWQKSNLQSNIKIDLMNSNGNQLVANLYNNVSKTATSKNWAPTLTTFPGTYRIRVSTMDGQVSDTGDQFQVVVNPNILYPANYNPGTITGPAIPSSKLKRSRGTFLNKSVKPKFLIVKINNTPYSPEMNTPMCTPGNPIEIFLSAISSAPPVQYRVVINLANPTQAGREYRLMYDSGWKSSGQFSITIPTNDLDPIMSGASIPTAFWGKVIIYAKAGTPEKTEFKECRVNFTN